MKRKKLFASIATFALSIAFMMFGVYAAASPSVKLSGQISYQVYDAKVLARGRIENAKTFDGSADVNAATYPTKNDADYKSSTKVNTQSQYLDYTIGDEKGDSTDNFTAWTFGDIAFNENNVNPIKMYLEFTNYSLYDIVATVTFEKTEQELTTGNLKRTVSETQVVIAGYDQAATSKEILIEYDVLNRGTKVNKFNVNASITIEQYFDEGGNGGGSQTPTNPPNATLEGWTYTDNGDNTITLTAYNGSETEIVVPTILDGKTVTGIMGSYDMENDMPASVFANASDITSVTLPSTLETIGDFALVGMENLQSLIVPEGVKSLGMGAIAMCSQLSELTLPSTLQTIGDQCFVANSSMTQIVVMAEVPPTLGADVFAVSALTNVYVPEDSVSAYQGADVWKDYTILPLSQGPLTYGDWKYYFDDQQEGVVITKYTGSETEIEIPSQLPVDGQNKNVVGITSVSYSSTFANASNVTSVTLPSTLIEIGPTAFESTGLTNIEIPEGVTMIGEGAFYGCSSLTQVTLPSTLKVIETDSFRNTGLTNIEIPEGVTIIGVSAFYNCSSLTQATLPSTLKEIGSYAFYNTGLTSVEIPEEVTTIESHTFEYCESLAQIILPSTLQEIEDSAFSNTGLTSIKIPKGVAYIWGSTFYKCDSLTEIVVMAENPPTLAYTQCLPSAVEVVYVQDEYYDNYTADASWNFYTIKKLSEKND